MGASGLPARGSTMKALRRILVIACVIALAAFGAAACGKKSDGGGGGGGGGGEINVALTLVPRLRRPAALLHGRGLGGALERLHPAADLQARQGQGRHPGGSRPGRGHARHLARRQDLQAQAAAEHEVLGRHAHQGVRFHLRHPAAVQGRLRRLGVLRQASSAPPTTPTARRRPSAASRPTTTPATSPSR